MTKKLKIFTLVSFLLFSITTNLFAQKKAVQPPFTKGVNMTGWFEIWEKGIPNLNKYSYEDFLNLKELGVDVVRLPVHFYMMMDDQTGEVEEIVWDYLDQVCDWAEELEIYLIIDNHSFNSGKYPSAKVVKKHLETVWPQIAERYKDRSEYILYEILNEPQISQESWAKIQKYILSLIREYDTKHTVVVTGAEWGGRDAMIKLKPLDDDNLIYSFHYYDPFYFSHQGASWCSAEIEALHDIPFPYDKNRMPALEGAAKGSYLEQALRTDYQRDATEKTMRANLQNAVDFSIKYEVPVFVGEFGIYSKEAPYEDRITWFKTVGKFFQELGLSYTIWGYDDGFSFFRKGNLEYPYGLDSEILTALDFNVPEGAGTENQNPPSPQTLPLVLYDDLPGKNIRKNAWYSGENAIMASQKGDCPEGNYHYLLSNIDRYGVLTFTFANRDLTVASDLENTCLHFYIKTEDENQNLQIRFIEPDTKDNIPWRFAYDFPISECTPGEWYLCEIPLSDFTITGAWSNLDGGKWYSVNNVSSDIFDWSNVEGLTFVPEAADLKGSICLDDIKILEISSED